MKLAVVGLGLVGKRHVAAIQQSGVAELSAVVEPSMEGKAEAAKLGVVCFDGLKDLFNAQQPDGIILSTPTPMHLEQALDCIECSIPLLVEKPLTVSAGDGAKIVAAASQKNVPVLTGHHRRYNPLIQKARAIIDEGLVGDIRSLHANCWFYKPDAYFDVAPWRKKKGAGPISVNLVHDVDLMRYLCGEIVAVQANAVPSARGFENEDVAAAILSFENGAIGTITVSDSIASPWSWELTSGEYPVYTQTPESCYRIGGSKASLSIPDLKLWSHGEKPDWWEPIAPTDLTHEASDPLVNQIIHFTQVIAQDAAPLVSAEEGYRTLKVIEAIQMAASTGDKISL